MVLFTRNQTVKMSHQQSFFKTPEHNTLVNQKKNYVLTKQLILNLALNVKNSFTNNSQTENLLISEASLNNIQAPEHEVYIEIIDPKLKPIDFTDNIS